MAALIMTAIVLAGSALVAGTLALILRGDQVSAHRTDRGLRWLYRLPNRWHRRPMAECKHPYCWFLNRREQRARAATRETQS